MNLFFKKLFGILQSTEKFEARDEKLLAELINYKKFESSDEYAEYKKLAEIVNTPEFKEMKKKLSAKEYKETPEYAQEARFNEIASSSDFKFFMKTDYKKFKRIADLTVYVKDRFNYKNLSESKWKSGFFYTKPGLKTVHSLYDEQQANMGGANIVTGNGLSIQTKRQNVTAPAWREDRGFVEKEYGFTSDMMHGHDMVEDEYCGIRVKMRCTGKVGHAFWLTSGDKIPHINVALVKGKKIEVGVYDARGDYYYTTVRGINPSKYHIYSIYQKDGELIWRINNVLVYRTRNIIAEKRFFPAFSSFIPANMKNPTDGSLDIEWVEIYK